MKHSRKEAGRLAMVGPVVLFVGVFVVCCGILTCVFFRSAQLSREATRKNAAVALCRSQAERLRAGKLPQSIGWFDDSLDQCAPEEAAYLLRAESAPRDGCTVWSLTVCSPEGERLYGLEIYTEEAGS